MLRAFLLAVFSLLIPPMATFANAGAASSCVLIDDRGESLNCLSGEAPSISLAPSNQSVTAATAIALPIEGTDYDSIWQINNKNNYSSIDIGYTSTKQSNLTRKNRNFYASVTVTWRKSTDAASIRNSAPAVINGVVSATGAGTNTIKGNIRVLPANIASGTYYFYFVFKTLGGDTSTSIYKVIL